MAREVPSIDRALSVLEALARTRGGLTLSDLSRKLKMPRAAGNMWSRRWNGAALWCATLCFIGFVSV